MIEFLRKLLGISKPPGPNLPESRATSKVASSASEQTAYQGEKKERPVSRNDKSPSGRAAVDDYFQLSAVIETRRDSSRTQNISPNARGRSSDEEGIRRV